MTASTQVSDLQSKYAPLTEAEAEVVLRRLEDEDTDSDVDTIVAEVKAERAGPAAQWEDVPELEAPVVDEIAAVRAALDQAGQRRIDAAGNDSDRAIREVGRLKKALDDINAYLIGDAEKVFEAHAAAETPDVEEDATAAELVAHLRDHPGDADAVEEAENAREGGPRKSVVAAVEKAKEGQS